MNETTTGGRRLLGVRARGDVDSAMPAWARRTFAGLILIAVILAAPLLLKGMEKNRAGQVRPISFPVSSEVRDAVKQFVASKENLRLLTMGREGIEPGAKIIVLLTATGPVFGDFRGELRQLIHEVRTDSPLDLLEDVLEEGGDPWVRIFILEEALIQAAG